MAERHGHPLVGARDLRTLCSRVLQHHHHQSRSLFSSSFLSSVLLLLLLSRLQQHITPPGHALLLCPLSSSSSSLACSNATLLLQATLPRVENQRMVVLAPPMLEPENGRAHSTRAGEQRVDRPSVTDPTQHPPWRARLVKIQECWAGPSWPSVTNPSSVTARQEN